MNAPLNLSGNRITLFPNAGQGRQDFAIDGPYRMYQIYLAAGSSYVIDQLTAFTILLLKGTAQYTSQADTGSLSPHDTINVVAQGVTLTCQNDAQIIVAGIVEPVTAAPQIQCVVAADQYRVDKPWGHELWFSGTDNPYYSLKEVFIRQGNRTSLQYHHFKYEANVIFDGTARLYYQKNMDCVKDDLTPDDLGTHDVTGLAAINITPEVVHRLFAVTDVMIYETSTPHLDDVIRISDDSGRNDGRIASEHQGHNTNAA
jgi:mannose-6-phosphate isomerase